MEHGQASGSRLNNGQKHTEICKNAQLGEYSLSYVLSEHIQLGNKTRVILDLCNRS